LEIIVRPLKITTWNIEHFQKALEKADTARLDAIRQEIREIAPDVLCLVEAPWSPSLLQRWLRDTESGLGGEWVLPLIEGTDAFLDPTGQDDFKGLARLHAMQGNATTGGQWIWFLVRRALADEARLTFQPPAVWQSFTGGPAWYYRAWNTGKRTRHTHWRHPQVLRLGIAGFELEFIGAHLKSKINTAKPIGPDGDLSPAYVETALTARIKLTSEADDIRRYIDARFDQEPEPRIIVLGDLNDGPGREYFEREYLHHDLIGALQGDVFFATRFLNHALFDYEDRLRWSTEFTDKVETWSRTLPEARLPPESGLDTAKRQLIDHILFTQALSGAGNGPKVRARSGCVEHTIHERIQAGLKKITTSDHHPVSMVVEFR
jgi:exonuclease III